MDKTTLDYDSFDMPLNDDNIVAISKNNELEIGIYSNHRVLTLDEKLNMNQINGIMKIEHPNRQIYAIANSVRDAYSDELKNSNKEIVIGTIPIGSVLVTKNGFRWLYLGPNWVIYDHESYYSRRKSGSLYIPMQNIDTNKSLRENLNEIIEDNVSSFSMTNHFRLSYPKAVEIDDSYSVTTDDIEDFIRNGLIGIFNNENDYSFLLNSSYRDSYDDIKDLIITRSIHNGIRSVRPYDNTIKRTVKSEKKIS